MPGRKWQAGMLGVFVFGLTSCSSGSIELTRDSGDSYNSRPVYGSSIPPQPDDSQDSVSRAYAEISLLEFDWDDWQAHGYVLYRMEETGFDVDGVKLSLELLVHPDPSRPILTRESGRNFWDGIDRHVCSALVEWPAGGQDNSPLVRLTGAPRIIERTDANGLECLLFGAQPRRLVLSGDSMEATLSAVGAVGAADVVRFRRAGLGIGSPWVPLPGSVLPVLKTPQALAIDGETLIFGTTAEGAFKIGSVDLATATWKLPENDEAPVMAGSFGHAWTGDRLLVTDGATGATYDPATRQWATIDMTGAGLGLDGHRVARAAFATGKVYVWVSALNGTRSMATKQVFGIYDLATATWSEPLPVDEWSGHMVDQIFTAAGHLYVWLNGLEGERSHGLQVRWSDDGTTTIEMDNPGSEKDFELTRVGSQIFAVSVSYASTFPAITPVETGSAFRRSVVGSGEWTTESADYQVLEGRSRVGTETGILRFGGIVSAGVSLDTPDGTLVTDVLDQGLHFYKTATDANFVVPAMPAAPTARAYSAIGWSGKVAVIWGGCVKTLNLECQQWADDGALIRLDLF